MSLPKTSTNLALELPAGPAGNINGAVPPIGQQASHQDDVVDGIDMAAIIGHSMGGKAAMAMALRWPDLVRLPVE